MTALLAPEPAAAGAQRPRLVRPSDVVDLQAVHENPCASVLMSTTPGPRMRSADADRLMLLVADGARRLAAEPDRTSAMRVADRLSLLAADAAVGSVATGIGLFASPTTARLVHLPVSVTDRVVIDPTFATRDLVRSLQRRPPHLVLVLGRIARLFADDGHGLTEVRVGGLPVRLRGSLRDRLRHVDGVLGTVLGRRTRPVVVVGDRHQVGAFLRHSRHQHALAGAVGAGLDESADAHALADQVRPVLADFLGDRERAALDRLARRQRNGGAISGLVSCWEAAATAAPEMLVVEETLAVPARLAPDGSTLLPTGDVEALDVLDDAVDELIELVLARGGWVALVGEGMLADHGGIALTLRPGAERS